MRAVIHNVLGDIASTTTYSHYRSLRDQYLRAMRRCPYANVLIFKLAMLYGACRLFGVEYYILSYRLSPLSGQKIGEARNPGPQGRGGGRRREEDGGYRRKRYDDDDGFCSWRYHDDTTNDE